MRHAKELLRSDMPIDKIALVVGYTNQTVLTALSKDRKELHREKSERFMEINNNLIQ